MNLGRGAATLVASSVLAVAVVVGAADDSAAVGGAHRAEAGKAERLVAFGSCGALLAYSKAQAARFVGPWGLGSPAIAVGSPPATTREAGRMQGVDYSGTNVQEEGVDESDLVKTNGDTLFAVANGRLNAVDVAGGKPRLLDTLKLDAASTSELLLYRDRLLVLSRGGFWTEPLPAAAARIGPYVPSRSVVTEVDVSEPKTLRVVRTLTLDGAYVAARLVGRSARIVVASQVPAELKYDTPADTTTAARDEARERNRAVVAASKVSSWLPHYRIAQRGRATRERPLVQCRHVSRPAKFSGLGMLTVLTMDLAKGLEPVDTVALMTDARIVYASPESLYVATESWQGRPEPAAPMRATTGAGTALHKFDISSPTRTAYRGSGRVSGYLLSQWSLSEHRGVLRVVSTETPAWWGQGGESESRLTTLRQKEGELVELGHVGGLGKGERVYAVRFVGNTGYVVTFRQVDPLHTVDLADPERPRVLGELKVPGYSAYLHPIGEDLLLGIGQEADAQGRLFGTQLSIFDVSDLRHPTRLDTLSLGRGWSEAEADHHAFLFWPTTGLVVVPFDQRAAGFRVGRARGLVDVGRVSHPGTAAIRRSLVIRDAVLTVSDAGVAASSLSTLAQRGWATFPAPDPSSGGSKPPRR